MYGGKFYILHGVLRRTTYYLYHLCMDGGNFYMLHGALRRTTYYLYYCISAYLSLEMLNGLVRRLMNLLVGLPLMVVGTGYLKYNVT